MKVSNLVNSRGNAVKNQFVLVNDKGDQFFQSYDSIIAKVDVKERKIYLDRYYWDYSATTLKHLKAFLNISDSKAQMIKDIDRGLYQLADLNK